MNCCLRFYAHSRVKISETTRPQVRPLAGPTTSHAERHCISIYPCVDVVTRGASVPRLPLSATHEEASLWLESLCLPSASETGRAGEMSILPAREMAEEGGVEARNCKYTE
ncbi:uncharacterized protein LOC125030466 [Penaeus chinensis]|uniref:uncharacterized protein LOC125030466 n=1 Tax=Penaeus chinensis TaxID=139456 RepID=UPI001FB81007|nr:uncharacterized protein LOC125030466 [Penaeus chinensis]